MILEKIFKLSFLSFLFTSFFSGINFILGNLNSYNSGIFSKFSSIFFSISDIFLFLSIFLLLIHLFKNKKQSLTSENFGKFSLNFFEKKEKKYFTFLFSGLFISSFLTSFFIENFSNLLLHFSILVKFFSTGFLFFYTPEKLFSKKEILSTLIFSLTIQGFISFYQVIFQSPVGLFFLGENNFGENILGVAKISLENGENFIRGYGTLSHPNILGLSSLILYFLSRKSDYFFLKNFLLIGIFFSFSKTAIIGFFILKIYEKTILSNKSQGQKNNFLKNILLKIQNKKTSSEIELKTKFGNIFYKIFYSSLFIGFFLIFGEKIFIRFQNFFGTGFDERILQIEISKNISIENILNFNFFGIGFGNFTLQMQNFTNQILKPWEIQPVHNFFILFGTEIGIIGLGFLLSLIGYIFYKSEKKFTEKFFLILILFFSSFFDHFLLTSSIGIILFWLILRKIYY